ncbi:MAG: hypothetical protein AB8F95_04740 [Bacteroidia bacterium]
MKTYINIFILLSTAFLLVFSACKKDELPPIGKAPSKLEGINGAFKLVKIQRTDKLACANRPTVLDVSHFFLQGEASTISFDTNAKTFSYNAGDATSLLPETGSWKFVNENFPDQADEFPEAIEFVDQNGIMTMLDLKKPIRPLDPTLEIESTTMSDGKVATGYIFVFERM